MGSLGGPLLFRGDCFPSMYQGNYSDFDFRQNFEFTSVFYFNGTPQLLYSPKYRVKYGFLSKNVAFGWGIVWNGFFHSKMDKNKVFDHSHNPKSTFYPKIHILHYILAIEEPKWPLFSFTMGL